MPAIPCFAGTGQGIGSTTSHAARKCIVRPILRKADYGGLRRDEGVLKLDINPASVTEKGFLQVQFLWSVELFLIIISEGKWQEELVELLQGYS